MNAKYMSFDILQKYHIILDAEYLCQQNIIVPQKKGCTKDAMGYKEQHIIDSVGCAGAH